MNTTSFDTLSAAQDLEAAGIKRRQAEAIAEGMRRAAGADHDALATKADIADLKANMLKVAIGVVIANATLTAVLVFGALRPLQP